jgi:UDPglucose 6-dehydrogenase
MKEKIAIIGVGYVGSKIYDFFKQHGYDVYRFDINTNKSDVKKIEDFDAYNLDFAFICVPTPMSADGSCDVSLVENAVKRIKAKTIVIQSTIAPGTTKILEHETGKDILFVPEYFGETKNHFLNDLDARSFFVIGGRAETRKKLVNLYKNIFDSKQLRFGFFDSTTAEVIKYIDNSYLAAKVLFCEEFFRICEALKVDYDEVREGWLLDPRIDPSHTFARKDGLPGFGGKCYPKDISAIIEASKKAGHNPELLDFISKYNRKIRGNKP